MKKFRLLSKALCVVLAVAMLFAVAVPAFAAANPDTNGTPTQYNNTANITVGKTLNATGDGLWPDITEFTFKLEASGYTAGPDTTNAAYTAYTTANLPMPAAQTSDTATPESKGSNTAAAGTPLATTITVTGFSNTAAGTSQHHQFTTGAATYTQAGVYTYKLTENVPADNAKVPGVTYDTSVYYVNVYVTNVLHEDGTPVLGTDGKPLVNVSSITAYKGTNGATDPTAPDFNNIAAAANENDAKIGLTTPTSTDGETRNIAYPFVNDYTTRDITVTKKVTGTMADINKQFTFTLNLQKLTDAANSTYAADTRNYKFQVFSMGSDEVIGGTGTAADTAVTGTGKSGAAVDASGITNGETFTLKHNEYVIIYGLPKGEKYTVTEADALDYKTTITPQNGAAAGTATIINLAATTAKTAGEQTLSIADGAVNRTDFINNKEAITPTGVLLDVMPYVLILGAAAAAFVLVSKKRRTAQ
jgi:pilin isopeptide linkage protein